jgi:hypothetical protein
MKRYRIAHLSVVIALLAAASPKLMAQAVAAGSAFPSVDTAAIPSMAIPIGSVSILAYQRPTEKQKLRLFIFDAFGPYAGAKALLGGAYQQYKNAPPEWGGGAKPFGERVASNFGIELVTTTTRYGMAEILHEDAAYYPCGCRGFFHRFRHAVVSTVTARHGEDGHTTFSISGLASPYAGTMAALAWYPKRYGVEDGFRMGNYNLAIAAVENLALEFLYGGPHSMFSHIASFKTPGGTAADQKP